MKPISLLTGWVVCLSLVGCFEVATHLSFGQRGEEADNPVTPPPPEPVPFLPTISSNLLLPGSGAVKSRSQNFNVFSSGSPLSGTVSEGTLYRWTKPELSLGQQEGKSP